MKKNSKPSKCRVTVTLRDTLIPLLKEHAYNLYDNNFSMAINSILIKAHEEGMF